jgi:hypothetical protein
VSSLSLFSILHRDSPRYVLATTCWLEAGHVGDVEIGCKLGADAGVLRLLAGRRRRLSAVAVGGDALFFFFAGRRRCALEAEYMYNIYILV